MPWGMTGLSQFLLVSETGQVSLNTIDGQEGVTESKDRLAL